MTDTDTTPAKDEIVDAKGTPVDQSPAAPEVQTVEPTPDSSDKGFTVVHGDVPAQVKGPEHEHPGTVSVHEVTVNTDRFILDTSDPLAVQRGPKAPVPSHDNLTPEQVFAKS